MLHRTAGELWGFGLVPMPKKCDIQTYAGAFRIVSIKAGTPADRHGLRKGELIVGFAGHEGAMTVSHVKSTLGNDASRRLEVRLAPAPAPAPTAAAPAPVPAPAPAPPGIRIKKLLILDTVFLILILGMYRTTCKTYQKRIKNVSKTYQ